MLGVHDLTHDFSGVVVLADVNFIIRPGHVHALLGENGSGKSTMIKIITGALRPSAGRLLLDGEAVVFSSPEDARAHGIGVVHQDSQLFPDLTVGECVYGVNKPPPRRRYSRFVDRGAIDREVQAIFAALKIEISPARLVRTLTAAERKFVEIARAMVLQPRFLILDEPTASFERPAARAVLDLLGRLREQQIGLCFVSHRLDEVLSIADDITVLRDGAVVGALERGEATEEKLVRMIVGNNERAAARLRGPAGKRRLRLAGVELVPGRPIDLELRRGEIVGLVGLVGSGAATLVRMLGGAELLTGEVEIDGRPHRITSPRDAARLGIGFIPEDRKGEGLVEDQSVAVNISLSSLRSVSWRGVLNKRRLYARAEAYREKLAIRARSIQAPIRTLSGGNQQKAMIAKWLASGVTVLAIEEPTHGVDVGGKAQIHNLMRDFAAEGGAILLASTDVNEVLEVCDRIVILRHGVATDTFTPQGLAGGSGDPADLLGRLVESAEPVAAPTGSGGAARGDG